MDACAKRHRYYRKGQNDKPEDKGNKRIPHDCETYTLVPGPPLPTESTVLVASVFNVIVIVVGQPGFRVVGEVFIEPLRIDLLVIEPLAGISAGTGE